MDTCCCMHSPFCGESQGWRGLNISSNPLTDLICDCQPSFPLPLWPGCLSHPSGYSLKLGLPCKDRTLSALFHSVSACFPHCSALGSSCLSLSCALGVAAGHQANLITIDFLPVCLPASHPLASDILVGISSWAEPIFWILSWWCSCQLVRSLGQPQNLTVRGVEFRYIVGYGAGLGISSSWQSPLSPLLLCG